MKKLLFIYNANSGKLNNYLGGLHKILRPENYPCKLCEITYGVVSEKKEWKEFRKSLDIEMEFFHKDEFQKQYASKFGYKFTFPIVIAAVSGGLEVFISTEELKQMKSEKELINLVKKRMDVI